MRYNVFSYEDMSMTVDADPSLSPDARTAVRAVLLTAATRWEAQPLADALGLSPAGAGIWRGTVGGRALTLIKTGMGAKSTSQALGAAAPSDFQLALSAGLCGSLQASVHPGDIVADPHEVELELVLPLRETAKALALHFHFGRILHTNIVLQPEAKRRLGAEHRAAACDMETQAVRRWAYGTPLAVIGVRGVLDGLEDALPADAPEGEDFASLGAFALSRPLALPGLLLTGWRARRAMAAVARLLRAYLEGLAVPA